MKEAVINMTGRERFNAIIDHKRPDKMPFYIPTVSCTVASEILSRPVFTGADSLHFHEELAIYRGEAAHKEFEEKYYEDTVDLHRALRVDIVRDTWRSKERAVRQLDENTLMFGDEDGEYYIKRFFPGPQTYGIIKDTRKPKEPEELQSMFEKELSEPVQLPDYQQSIAYIAGGKRIFDLHRAKGDDLGEIIAGGGGLGLPIDNSSYLELALLEPELLREHYMRVALADCVRMRFLAREGYRWFSGGHDMATMISTIYSPNTFKAVLADAVKTFADCCAEENVVFCYKSDGNMWGVFDIMFNECGVQAYGEVDRDATMTVADIRKRNSNLLILGNMSSAFLHLSSEQAVRDETRKMLDESEGLNFIPGPSNAIMSGTPVKNVFAMIEEIERFVP